MPSRTFGKFEVPKFYKLPVLEKPQQSLFHNLILKDFQKILCFLSFARPCNIKRYNSAIPVLVIEHKKYKQKSDLLLSGELIHTNNQRKKLRLTILWVECLKKLRTNSWGNISHTLSSREKYSRRKSIIYISFKLFDI